VSLRFSLLLPETRSDCPALSLRQEMIEGTESTANRPETRGKATSISKDTDRHCSAGRCCESHMTRQLHASCMQVSSGRMHQGDDTFRVVQGIRSCQVSPIRPHVLSLLTSSSLHPPFLMQSPSSPSSLLHHTIITAIIRNDRQTLIPSQQMLSPSSLFPCR
jgi:hypothetical protein